MGEVKTIFRVESLLAVGQIKSLIVQGLQQIISFRWFESIATQLEALSSDELQVFSDDFSRIILFAFELHFEHLTCKKVSYLRRFVIYFLSSCEHIFIVFNRFCSYPANSNGFFSVNSFSKVEFFYFHNCLIEEQQRKRKTNNFYYFNSAMKSTA